MVSGLWGKKIGMTQVFSKENAVVPVTVIDVAGWFVTNVRTVERDGYTAVQLGRVKKRYEGVAFSASWLKNLKKYFSVVREVRFKIEDQQSLPSIGESIDITAVLQEGLAVDVFGTSKGCGFAGVVRRHNFAGPPKSHGSTMGNRTGSIGFNCSCGSVIKGKAMPGQMGAKNTMVKNLEVVRVDHDAKVVLVKGAVPGKSGSLVFISREMV